MKLDKLSRMMVYMLGRRPDEFGLVPDREGFVTYKELLRAYLEESGWQYVRRSHINEVLVGKDRSLYQPEENRIRVLERHWRLDCENPLEFLPKILFTPIRRKAHPVAMEKGLKAPEGRYLILSSDKHMAMRIGRRRDQRPVLLEIMPSSAQGRPVFFYSFGTLFLTRQVPAKFISGPPVSKALLESLREKEAGRDIVEPEPVDFAAGTFSLDMSRDPDLMRRAKGKKQKGWKEEARKFRKTKRGGGTETRKYRDKRA